MTRIEWTKQAVSDVEEIKEFISRDSPRYGRLVTERIYEATERIKTFPYSGRRVPDFDRDDVREIILGEYRIVYRILGDVAQVLTVFRSSRLFPLQILEPK